MPPSSSSQCSCENYKLFLRIFVGISHLATATSGAYGFILCNTLFQSDDREKTIITALTVKKLAIFTGIMALYFTAFALLGLASEIRKGCCIRAILYPFNFTRYAIGRGVLCLILGSLLLLIPWDEDRPYVGLVPASFQLVSGILLVFFGVFVTTGMDVDSDDIWGDDNDGSEVVGRGGGGSGSRSRRAASAAGMSGAGKKQKRPSEASGIVWGSPDVMNQIQDQSGDGGEGGGAGSGMGDAGGVGVGGEQNPVVANLFRSTSSGDTAVLVRADMGSGSGGADSSTTPVSVQNPFAMAIQQQRK